MNDKQNNKHRFSANEEQLAEQTVRMLESRTNEDRSQDDQATAELGQLLRDAARGNLPESNVDLREQLIAELDGGSAEPVTVADKLVVRSVTRRRFWVAAAASGLLLVGGAIAYNSGFVGTLSNVAMLNNPSEASVEPSVVDRVISPEGVSSDVVFRTETRTKLVPVTKMRVENKTRSVPITKIREETRRMKQADGSFRQYKVQVPYTVKVPYTADGKRIEKSDYGKYGLGVAVEKGIADEVEPMKFPSAEEWRDHKLLRRSHFKEFRLTAELDQNGDEGRLGDSVVKTYDFQLNSNVPSQQGSQTGDLTRVVGPLSKRKDEHFYSLTGQTEEASEAFGSSASGKSKPSASKFYPLTQLDEKTERKPGMAGKPKRPAEFMSGGEVPLFAKQPSFQGRSDAETLPLADLGGGGLEGTVRMWNGQSMSGPVSQGQNKSQLFSSLDCFRLDNKFFEQSSSRHRISKLDRDEDVGRMEEYQRESDVLHRQLQPLDGRLAALKDAEANTGEQYEPIFENAFIAAKGPTAISTFSIDVDTASYANMRRLLNSGQRPPADSIRLEELVNYFQYDYDQPTGDQPFFVNLELADCPWQDGHQLLRVGLKGKDVHVAERPATNVVFLIDVSGSMSSSDKLPLLKSGFKMMSRQLGKNDRVSIVTYAGNAGVVLNPTNGTQTETINSAIDRLSSGGSTHGSAGIKLAYELAQQNFIEGGVNRVMLATDGDLNVGVTNDDALVSLIKEKAAEGVFLTVLGFGTGNLKDGKLEKLADNGNGMYAYIDSTREARRVLVDQLSGSLVTIAKDVKIQVEFNPAEVKSYRLLGYENRMLETKDFDDDRKDAGEIGAGHSVTAIYQIEPAKAVDRPVSLPTGMKYQVQAGAKPDVNQASVESTDKDGLSKAAMSGELATVALRYKQPEASESQRLEVSIKNQSTPFMEASTDFRFASSVAGFGMYLRNSKHRGSINADQLLQIGSGAIGKDEAGYRSEFIDLIRKASGR